ncbi:MAG: hypothetical protein RLZZ399_431 [Verrucomicrobiota bacterium]|jgi:hydrophobe/amphiphile efflux-1 (HAE1) family protein
MNLSEPFIRRPVGTSLLALGLLLLGLLAYRLLPVAPLPRIDFPIVQVSAFLPGADPATMAATVAAPLERRFGQIAGVSEMTSVSTVGSASVTLQFQLERSIEGAVKDVQAAVNAARADLPGNLPAPPTYRKVNPADSPIMILSLSSDLIPIRTLYEFADTLIGQKISQVDGVSLASINGTSKSAIRVRLNPGLLAIAELGMEDLRSVISQASIHLPKGNLEGEHTHYSIETNDQLTEADQYASLIVTQKLGVPVPLREFGEVTEDVENYRVAGWSGKKRAVLIAIFKQSDANVIKTVDGIRAVLPQIKKWLPPSVDLKIESERTKTIRAAVDDVQHSLLLSVGLVVLVMVLFLRRLWPTAIASVTIPLALAGTFGGMYCFGYSLDNLSIMALTISVGFVVDDAIVVIENIVRFIEAGENPLEAALKGARQIGFTVVSITVSLIAVFIPILGMSGLIGRLLHAFAVTLTLSVVISAVISLTLTPSLCARFLTAAPHPSALGLMDQVGALVLKIYRASLGWLLKNPWIGVFLTLATIGWTCGLYGKLPKGFFPQQDTGMMMVVVEASQDISFPAMSRYQERVADLLLADPAVDTVASFLGGTVSGASNSLRMYVALRPLAERNVTVEQLILRLRKQVSSVDGARVFMQGMQDIRVGGRTSKAQYQFALQSPDLSELNTWAPKVVTALRASPLLKDLTSDQQTGGLKTQVHVDRDAASRLGVSLADVDATLYDAFGQRQVANIYKRFNQHRVVMEVDENHLADPTSLEKIVVRAKNGSMVPLSAFSRFEPGSAMLSVNHQGQFPSVTISFNLTPGSSLGEATDWIEKKVRELILPQTIRTSFQGTAQVFQSSLSTLPKLTFWALVVVYLVLGILYESWIHPLTIISTLPSAGLGALLALQAFGYELSIVSFIGILLLMGIVKKNAIMMVDFALELQRERGIPPIEAILEASVTRFRPITMTTLAALFGSVPLAFGAGVGSELRRPLGIALVGGLMVSQILTLYTTPVVYLSLDKVCGWWRRLGGRKALDVQEV